jgi:hypothetical protein
VAFALSMRHIRMSNQLRFRSGELRRELTHPTVETQVVANCGPGVAPRVDSQCASRDGCIDQPHVYAGEDEHVGGCAHPPVVVHVERTRGAVGNQLGRSRVNRMLPMPSTPYRLLPQQRILPSLMRTHVLLPPAETKEAFVTAATAGALLRFVVVPSPS